MATDKKPKREKGEKVEKAEKAEKVEKVEKTKAKAKAMTKSEVFQHLAEATQVNKKDIAALFDALLELIGKELSKKGPGQFTIPGLLKLRVVRKPATKATTRPNPFKPGEMMEVKAKGAKNAVRARPLKTLNEKV